ncbi:JAB domain-containing protein [Candidatus Falkowbacteria bacterium]|nr:JAB domain-containing protein [Candidatus Falkowbacteria bacterium]NCT54443.1 JAB domain-containing protein [Candidatus Falkowbacteria bacterium]
MAYKIIERNLISIDSAKEESIKKYLIPRVKDLPNDEKPREKMIQEGLKVLSAAELLAIVLGVGTKKEEVMAMSMRLMREYGEKGIAYQQNPEIITKDLGVPIAKACQIVACFELGRRFYQKKSGIHVSIRNAKQAFEYLKDMGFLKKEQFRGLYLNTHYQLIHEEVISIGTLDSALVSPREVFRPALENSAAAIIVAHNHPSGVLKATKNDAEITEKLIEAGKIIGIEVLDHIIIGGNKYSSLI